MGEKKFQATTTKQDLGTSCYFLNIYCKQPHPFYGRSPPCVIALLLRNKISAIQSKVYQSTHICLHTREFSFEISTADQNCIKVDCLTVGFVITCDTRVRLIFQQQYCTTAMYKLYDFRLELKCFTFPLCCVDRPHSSG